MNSNDHQQRDIDYHKLIAAQYDRVVVEPRWLSIDCLFRSIPRHFPKKRAAMLDVGTGTGHMLLRYAQRFSQVVAIDHSAEMIDVARTSMRAQGLHHVEFVVTDALAFLGRGGGLKFDLVTCVGFLHHLEHDQLARMLALVRGVLAPEGVLVLAEPVLTVAREPTPISWWNRRYRERAHQYDVVAEDPDEAPLRVEVLHSVLDRCGLQRVGEGRGWEIFPRGGRKTLGNRLAIRALDAWFGRTGPVYWACCKAD